MCVCMSVCVRIRVFIRVCMRVCFICHMVPISEENFCVNDFNLLNRWDNVCVMDKYTRMDNCKSIISVL